jgi:hypothetical protein
VAAGPKERTHAVDEGAQVEGQVVGREPLLSVIQASFGCLVGAVLFRWLGSTYARGLRTVLLEREAASRARPETVDPETVSSTHS